MRIELLSNQFDPYTELATHQGSLQREQSGQLGANAIFIGSMRDFNEGEVVRSMFLEHYPGMTEKYLHSMAEQAVMEWKLLDILLLHRIGNVLPDDPIVLVAVWSAHRQAAFDACRQIMETLKSKAPFWKKEVLNGGQRWVEKNTPA